MPTNSACHEQVTEQVEREIRHYHMLRHPCVVQLRRVRQLIVHGTAQSADS
jgi:hypothetical protein